MIRFETFQLVSFVLSASLFVYMAGGLAKYFISGLIPKKPSPLAYISGGSGMTR